MKKIILLILSLYLPFFTYATPNFIPVQETPSLDGFLVTNGMQACVYPWDFATLGAAFGPLKLTKKTGAQRISSVHCNVSIDNTRTLQSIMITSSQQVNALPNAAECRLIINTDQSNQVAIAMDAIYVVPSATINRYIATDVDIALAGRKIISTFITCDAHDNVTAFNIFNVGVSYY